MRRGVLQGPWLGPVSISALVGTVLIGVGPLARALPPAPAPQVEIYISGSSAQDEALENLLRLSSGINGAQNLCEPGTLDIYRGTIHGTANRVYYCRTSR